MKNGTLVILLLVLVLLLGLVGGGYMLLNTDPEPRRHGNQVADTPDNTEESPKVNVGNTPKPDTPKPDTPKPDTPKPDTPKPDTPRPDTPKPDTPKPDTPKATWKTKEIEVTVTGTVHYKYDNRPAVGVNISAASSDEDLYARWGDSEWAKSMRERPRANPRGSTVTDGEGKFTLKLTVTGSNGQELNKSGRDGDRGESDKPVEPGYLASFFIVATEPGYAPAHSQQLGMSAGDTESVALILAHPAAVRGRVVDGVTRNGIANAWVEFHYTERQDRTGYIEPRRLVTDAQGYFAVNDLPEARYGVTVGAVGYSLQDYWNTRRYADLTAGGEKDLGEIPLNQTVNIKGRVLDGQTKKPVKAAVSAERKVANRVGGPQRSGVINDDGTFVVEGVEPGTWHVFAEAKDYAKSTVEVTVTAGQNADVGDILLGPGVAVTGRVVDNTRKPKAGVEVKLAELKEAGPFSGGFPNEKGATTTDSEGRFTHSGLSEGRWQLSVEVEGFAPLTYKFEIKAEPHEVELVLLVGGTLSGVVTESGGQAVAGADILFMMHGTTAHQIYKLTGQVDGFGGWAGREITAKSNERGQFEFAHLAPGTYLVSARDGKGGQGIKDDIVVSDGARVDNVEITIAAKGSLEVTVLEDGKPAANITLTLWRGFMPVSGLNATSGENGVAVFKEVAEGGYTVRTSRDEIELDTDVVKRRAVQVKGGETTRFTLEMKPQSGARLFGRLSMNGRNEIFTTVMIVGVGPLKNVIKQAPVKNGEYEFRALVPGKYELHARQSQESVPATAQVEITQEGDAPFSRDFRGYNISGVVQTPANTPAERAQVKAVISPATSSENSFWMRGDAECDPDGQFTFENIATGTYLLTVSLAGVGSTSKEITVTEGDVSVDLSIGKTSGQLKIKITKLLGKAIRQGFGFALPALTDSAGRDVPLGEPNETFMGISEGSEKVLPTIAAGTYTATVRAMGYLAKSVANVTIEVGKTTTIELELTAAPELRVTFTNTDVTQEQCNSATITYWDANGKQVPVESNLFESFGTPPVYAKATVAAQYLAPEVTLVKIKLSGFAEISVPVVFEAGKLTASEVTLVQG